MGTGLPAAERGRALPDGPRRPRERVSGWWCPRAWGQGCRLSPARATRRSEQGRWVASVGCRSGAQSSGGSRRNPSCGRGCPRYGPLCGQVPLGLLSSSAPSATTLPCTSACREAVTAPGSVPPSFHLYSPSRDYFSMSLSSLLERNEDTFVLMVLCNSTLHYVGSARGPWVLL